MPSQAAHQLTRQHQAELIAVGAALEQEVRRVARTVSTSNVDAWWLRTMEELLRLVLGSFGASRRLGERYLLHHAALEGVELAPELAAWSTEQAATALRVTGPVAWKRSLAGSGSEMVASRTMADTLAGSAQRLALAGSRETVAGTIARSVGTVVGWRRVPDADPCAWCAMLASRGAVFTSREAAGGVVGRRGVTRGTRGLGMSFHDNDQCTVEPLYEHEDEPAYVDDLYQQWLEVTEGLSGDAAIRAWREHWDERRTPDRDRLRARRSRLPRLSVRAATWW